MIVAARTKISTGAAWGHAAYNASALRRKAVRPHIALLGDTRDRGYKDEDFETVLTT